MKSLPSYEEVAERLTYDPQTGDLRWLFRLEHTFSRRADFKTWNTKYAGLSTILKTPGRHAKPLIFSTVFRRVTAARLDRGYQPKGDNEADAIAIFHYSLSLV